MKRIEKWAAAAALSCGMLLVSPAAAQSAPERKIVSLYHAAPGEQEALIRWLANQDRVAAAAGVAPTQVYVHTDGAAWDFMIVSPVTTEAQDAAIEAAAKRMGVPTGPRASLAFRKHVLSHTDTFVMGPMTASDYLARLGPE